MFVVLSVIICCWCVLNAWFVLRWHMCYTVLGKVLVGCTECLQLGWYAQSAARDVVSSGASKLCYTAAQSICLSLVHTG